VPMTEPDNSPEWHRFDVERGYDVRPTEDGYEVRDESGKVTALTAEEFEQLRAEGENPKDL